MFFNRENELKRLNERYSEEKAQLIIMYGRRRVGKTELLQEFSRDKPHIFFLSDLSSEKEQLEMFSEKIRLFSQDESLIENPFSSWHALFAYIRKLAKEQRLIVIIDEYQYLQSSNKAMASIIQKVWDEGLKNTSIYLVLCGSYVSFIEQALLGYKSPLYGRRTGQFYIEPMGFYKASCFFESFSMTDRIRAYGILGGMPAYLLQFDTKKSIAKNIEAAFLHPDTFLNNEARFLLMEELKEPRNYFSILKAVALGKTRLNEIVLTSGLEKGTVVKYLDVLQNLRVIRREIPITETKPEKSRKGIYLIQDQYLKFWFRFIMPNQSLIAENRQNFLLNQRILPFLDQYLGPVYEKICIEFLKRINGTATLPFELDKIGRYWNREMEIDIVAFDFRREKAFVAECKWSIKKVGTNVLDDLIVKTSGLQKESGFKTIYYGLFSRSGFTDALVKLDRPDVFLFDLNDMVFEDG